MGFHYDIAEIVKWEQNIPFDKFNCALSSTWFDSKGKQTGDKEKAVKAEQLTNPYAVLAYGVGNSDYFIVFDYGRLPDGRIVLDSTVNSESACFIDKFAYNIVNVSEAAVTAQRMLNDALNALVENKVKNSGWGKSGYTFVSDIKKLVERIEKEEHKKG